MMTVHWIIILYTLSGVLSAVVVKDVNLGGSVTLPCKLLQDSPVKQLDVRWLLGEHLVIRLNQDQIIYSISYRNRTELPAGGAGRGDFSLTITHTQHGDSGVYRCVIFTEEQELKLAELQLSVEAPRSPSAVFIRAGDEVVLPCFGRVDWLDSEAEFVQWKRDWTVLEWVQGSLYVDSQFTDRVSLSKERILQDNISLELKNTRHEDQGLYECLFVKNKAVRLAAQINLTVTDHMTWVEAQQLPAPTYTSPDTVTESVNRRTVLIKMAPIFLFLLVIILTTMIMLKQQRQRRLTEEEEAESQHLNHTDFTRSKDSHSTENHMGSTFTKVMPHCPSEKTVQTTFMLV